MSSREAIARGIRRIRSGSERARQTVEGHLESHRAPAEYPIERAAGGVTVVESYWTGHTVNSTPFRSAASSLRYLDWRSAQYPRFHELMGLWGDHRGETVLDFGCGPGNDLVGFLEYSRARQVIGLDLSATALALARTRLALHAFDPGRVRLIKTSDADPGIPLADASVDYVHSEGVIHHLSQPEGVLRELRRVLRPNGRGAVMVYNRESLWLHLYVAYRRQILGGIDADLTVEEAFRRSTDGPDCPIATPFRPADFLGMLTSAGFNARYVGAYPARLELDLLAELGQTAAADRKLGEEHRLFLAAIKRDSRGWPTIEGRSIGVGGVYLIG